MSARSLVPRTQAWVDLRKAADRFASASVGDMFASDPRRYSSLSRRLGKLVYDFSRQRLDTEVLERLLSLADAADLRGAIESMWNGERINAPEDRAVLHVALRQREGTGLGGADVERQVLAERERMLDFAERVRSGAVRGSSGKAFTRVINIGIGGSDLGPAMAVRALGAYTKGAPDCRFVSNVDGGDLVDALRDADPGSTLFIVASKTFTTQETLANARAARAWIAEHVGETGLPQHFAAVSVNHEAMDTFGIHRDYRFQMWDWVGGRYSLWSSIGVSIAIAIGAGNFLALLDGGREMDEHFANAPWSQNFPVLMALLGIWNINFLKLPTLAVLPYDSRLSRFPAYLQQLEMESNGKSVGAAGEPIDWETGAVIWGEPGNNAQHSFFQLLHQGTQRAAIDLLLSAKSSSGTQAQHELAIANCLAQAEAFMAGQPLEVAKSPHKVHAGSRPVSLLVFDALTPAMLGRLIALYEHKVFAQSVIWGINAFDQWGVELGKKLCEGLVPAVTKGEGVADLPERLSAVLAEIKRQQV